MVSNITTIKLEKSLKTELDVFREHSKESYNDILKKILFIINKFDLEPELSKKELLQIKQSRERMTRGGYYTLDQAKKKLNL